MKIGEVAKQAGIATSTLRYYEQIGLLPAPQRRGGQRVYDAEIFNYLKIIKAGQRAGFSLDEIRTMIHEFSDDTPASTRWQSLAQQKLVELDTAIASLTAMKQHIIAGLDCRCATFDDCALMLE
ncbi:MAG: MerR family transcriptional regulator [Phototrophicales bacterium]|nr:MAG: MerR family transcriptional regulator [Phototrophicales bacterium]